VTEESIKIVEGKLYKIPEIMDITGRSLFKITYDIKRGKLKAIPHTKFEHYRVMGFNLKKYLGIS